MGRCGEDDGRCMKAKEVVKLATKRLALCNPDLGGIAVRSNQILIEPRHMRSDDSRPGDLYAVAGGYHAKDVAMDIIISSSLSKSYLQQISASSFFALKQAESKKFTKDLRNVDPIHMAGTQRLIPLATNQCGRRGPHFDAMLRESASFWY
jgi:hypothetical protein